MANFPAQREIPEGKILTAEYGTFDTDERAVRECLDEAWSDIVRSTVLLVQSSPGFEPAGSVARWTNGYYAVWWDLAGTIHGRRYHDEDAARAHFARITQSDVAAA